MLHLTEVWNEFRDISYSPYEVIMINKIKQPEHYN